MNIFDTINNLVSQAGVAFQVLLDAARRRGAPLVRLYASVVAARIFTILPGVRGGSPFGLRAVPTLRHCERSEAIQNVTAVTVWIASSLRSSQ